MLAQMRRHFSSCVQLALLVQLCSCGPAEVDDQGQRPDLAGIGGKADELPSWMRPMRTTFSCGDSVQGQFAGSDSAHLYSFLPLRGRLVGIDFAGSYDWRDGAAVAVYRADDGQLEQLLRNPWDSRVSLLFAPSDEHPGQELVVAVYSLAWAASGPYQVSAECPARTFAPGVADDPG
jgi:hypothetical protein